ncbi:MAG: alpha/beta hydrolase, partial [Pseudomonadota bacterium]|nr:alpha/beta hydrolase [Pseudomonadota bacterium]
MKTIWFRLRPILCLGAWLLCGAATTEGAPGRPGAARDRYFIASDGVRLHYLEAGSTLAHTIVFVPGWTMPAWIWAEQIAAFGRAWHVVAFDPRGQGASEIAPGGYTPARRGRDIAELVARVSPAPVVLVAWSLGVLDTLAYVHEHGDRAVAGLVLIDNSVGEPPPPSPGRGMFRRLPHAVFMQRFVRGLFREPQPAAYLDRLTEAALRTPEAASRALLSYAEPREYWRETLLATPRPVLYVVRPRFAAQAANLERERPSTQIAEFDHAGHA